MGFPPETSQTCWRKESASPSPPSAPLTCTWSWSNVRKTKRKRLKVKSIPRKPKDLFFFFLWPHTRGRSTRSGPWQEITGSDVTSGHRSQGIQGVCVGGRGVIVASSTSALSYSFQAAASGPGCHLGSSWHAEAAPTWPAAAAAAPSTSGGHSHPPVTPMLLAFTPINAHANVLMM